MLFQVEYRFAFVLFLAKTTTEGSEHGVFFQIKENSFFGFSEESLVWSGKTDSLLSCSALCGRETSCRRANFLENQRLCHLLRGEMQTSSAAGHLYQRDGSIYLTKVFATDDKLRGALPLKEKGELKFPFWIVLQFSQQEGNLCFTRLLKKSIYREMLFQVEYRFLLVFVLSGKN